MGHSESKFVTAAIQAIHTNNEARLKDLLVEYKQIYPTSVLNIHDPQGNTLLKTAVIRQRVNIVRMLLEDGADVNAPDSRGIICLHEAVKHGNEAMVNLLVEKGAYLNGRNDNFETALSVAVSKGSLSIVKMLLDKHANVNITDSFGNSPLHAAATQGDAGITQMLLTQGKDLELDGLNIEGYTPLMLAMKNDHLDIAVTLCNAGASPSIGGSDGVPPILVAVDKSSLALVDLFIEKEVNVNAQDKSGNTSLVLAIERGLEKIASALILAGASPYLNGNNRSPLHFAVERNLKQVVCAILDQGVDVGLRDSLNDTGFVIAVRSGHKDLVRLFMDRGADKDDLVIGLKIAAAKSLQPIMEMILAALTHSDILKFLVDIGPALDEKEKDIEEKNCIICFEGDRDSVIVPCGHAACCAHCLEGLPLPRLCPMCRVPIQLVQKVFRM